MVRFSKIAVLALLTVTFFASCATSPEGKLNLKEEFKEANTNFNLTKSDNTKYGVPIYYFVQKYPTIQNNDILMKQDLLIQIGEKGVDTSALLNKYTRKGF